MTPDEILERMIEAIPVVMAGRPTPLIWPLPKPEAGLELTKSRDIVHDP